MVITTVQTSIPYALIWQGKISLTDTEGQLTINLAKVFTGENKNVEMWHDRLGRVAYSTISIEFPKELDEKNIPDTTLRIINRLIDVYRYTTGEYYLERIPQNELRRIDVITRLNNGQVPLVSMSNFGEGLIIACYSDIPQEAIDILQSGEEPPIYSMLLLNAKRELLFENYRLAIVEAETAFEVYVDTIITEYYRKKGLSETAIKSKLGGGFKNLLTNHINKICLEEFVGCKEHSNWESKAYLKRNAIVHDGASANKQDTDEAIECVETAILWIQSRIK
jgi:hypothetical protein